MNAIYSINAKLGGGGIGYTAFNAVAGIYRAGILSRVLVNSMTTLVELRNLLVYEPGDIDDVTVYGFAKKRLDDFAQFSNVVCEYLTPNLESCSPQR